MPVRLALEGEVDVREVGTAVDGGWGLEEGGGAGSFEGVTVVQVRVGNGCYLGRKVDSACE